MCDAINARGEFDPDLCPLLKGLTPEERRARMTGNPRISACIAAFDGVGQPAAVCPHPELLPRPAGPGIDVQSRGS